jgi:hypothetical protein
LDRAGQRPDEFLFGICKVLLVIFRTSTWRLCVGVRVIFLQLPTLAPGVDLRLERIDRTLLLVKVTANREFLSLFPALYRADVPLEIRGDFFPGVEAVGRRVDFV